MNLSKYIGKTFRHPLAGVFICAAVRIDERGVMLEGDTVRVFHSECKRIRIVKRKKSQVLVDALEKYAQTHVWCLASMLVKDGKAGVDLWERLGADAKAALEKYREKEAKK